jgi:nucleoside-diphosphate-sugar epimerase
MKVSVTGATGYIAFNVATALRRAGHEVWGLVRRNEKARVLVRHEIRPVMGTLQEPGPWLKRREHRSIHFARYVGETTVGLSTLRRLN